LSERVQWALVSYPTDISANSTELSGEIKMAHPNKKVTIVHGARLPVSDHFPDYFREKAVKSLEEHGVDIILNEKIDIESAGKNGLVKLSFGKTLPADLVVRFAYLKSGLTLF
jgi:NADH dehydrogenase FAD-containing subunit